MTRLIVSLLLSVTIARWIYSEAQLVTPQLVPLIDYIVQATEIPTHDKWPKDSMQKVLSLVEQSTKVVIAQISPKTDQSRPTYASYTKEKISPLTKLAQEVGVRPRDIRQMRANNRKELST